MHSTWAQMLSVVTETKSRSMAVGLGYGSTIKLVQAIARIPRSEARARVNAAADVLPRQGVNGAPVEPKLPTTATTATTVADAATEIDLRTAPQPDADALIDLAARALSEGQLPTESGERPQVVLTISPPGTARPNRLSPAGTGWTDQHRYHPPTRPRRERHPNSPGLAR